MPLIQHNNLPSFERIQSEGVELCSSNNKNVSLPDIKIGFLNMMPDAAIAATERQFLRLVGANKLVNCTFYPFTINGIERSAEAQAYINKYYIDYSLIRTLDIDALIITGANVSQPLLQNELFWPELIKVLAWSKANVRSTLCSCLATHAAVKVFYAVDRQHLGDKCWGVYDHHVSALQHPLIEDVKSPIQMCHSRFNDIPKKLFLSHDVEVLIESEQVGVQLAAEKDNSVVYFQGHPEYDDISLLKEYKREIIRYIMGERNDYPPVPENYFNVEAIKYINEYQAQLEKADDRQALLDLFPEIELRKVVDNAWQESASTIFSNWVSLVAN